MDLFSKMVNQPEISNPAKLIKKIIKELIFTPLEDIKSNIVPLKKFTLAEII